MKLLVMIALVGLLVISGCVTSPDGQTVEEKSVVTDNISDEPAADTLINQLQEKKCYLMLEDVVDDRYIQKSSLEVEPKDGWTALGIVFELPDAPGNTRILAWQTGVFGVEYDKVAVAEKFNEIIPEAEKIVDAATDGYDEIDVNDRMDDSILWRGWKNSSFQNNDPESIDFYLFFGRKNTLTYTLILTTEFNGDKESYVDQIEKYVNAVSARCEL